MKQLVALATFVIASSANATIHTVTCQNGVSHFLPITVNAMVGDTIYWTWVSGTHIVGPILASDIPAGALMWDVPIDVAHLDFEYVVSMPGTYHYVCHPDAPHGEDGYIEVSSTTTVQNMDPIGGVFAAYPNPFTDELTVEASGANGMAIHDLLGRQLVSVVLKPASTRLQLDLATLPRGVFLCSILRNGVVLETKRLIKN